MRKFNVAVVGATGAVGEELFRVMEEVDFPVGELLPLASAKSVGMEIEFKGKNYKVKELTEKVLASMRSISHFLAQAAQFQRNLPNLQLTVVQ